jgi:hypothetical protein
MTLGGTSYTTSQVTTVTAGATTVTGYAPSAGIPEVQLVTFDVAGDDVRVFWEGSTPTSTSGHVLPGGTAYTWSANQYNNSKFCLSASSTASVITASPFNGG